MISHMVGAYLMLALIIITLAIVFITIRNNAAIQQAIQEILIEEEESVRRK